MSEGPGASESPALAVGSCVAGKTQLSADRLPSGLLAQAPPVGLSGGGTGRSLSFNPLPLPSPSIGYSERLLSFFMLHSGFSVTCRFHGAGRDTLIAKRASEQLLPCPLFSRLPVSPNRKAHGPSRLSHAVSTSTGSAFIFFICTDFAITRPWVLVPMLKICFLIEFTAFWLTMNRAFELTFAILCFSTVSSSSLSPVYCQKYIGFPLWHV